MVIVAVIVIAAATVATVTMNQSADAIVTMKMTVAIVLIDLRIAATVPDHPLRLSALLADTGAIEIATTIVSAAMTGIEKDAEVTTETVQTMNTGPAATTVSAVALIPSLIGTLETTGVIGIRAVTETAKTDVNEKTAIITKTVFGMTTAVETIHDPTTAIAMEIATAIDGIILPGTVGPLHLVRLPKTPKK